MVGVTGVKKILLLCGVAGLIATAAVAVSGAAPDDSDAAVEGEKKASQQMDGGDDSKGESSPNAGAAGQSVISRILKQEGNVIDRLLSESSKTNDQLDAAASKQKIFKLTSYGLGALAGLGGLSSLASVGYGRRKGEPLSGKAAAVGTAAALATILGVTGAALAYWQKRKAEDKAKTHARHLLAQRQAMLSKLHDVDETELEEVLARADDIATAADDLGMYVPDISDALPTPASEEKDDDN